MDYEVILRNGRVLDGVSRGARAADVGVRAGRVEAVDDLSAATAEIALDVSGRYVTPGFIDVHAHTDVSNLLGPEHDDVKTAGVRQGVTTEVCGNCGASPFPRRRGGEDPYLGLFPDDARRDWATLADYRRTMEAVPMAANLAPLLGHGTVRAAAMGHANRPPTGPEMDEMRRITATAMDDGAFGLSSGLIYAPGLFASTDELVALAEVLSSYGRPYTTHMRDEGAHLEAAVEEALRIGRDGGTGVQISHHKAAGRPNWGRSVATLAAIEQARSRGVDVTLDVYPYTAGSTLLSALLPPWTLEDGTGAMLGRLADPVARERIARDYRDGLPGWQNLVADAGWENVVVAGEPPAAGRSVAELAADRGQEPVDFVADLLLERPGTIIIIHVMDPDEVRRISDAPFAMIGSDGVPVPGQQHPRLAGTFARVLHWHAGDESRLADAVRRMTSLPAERFGLAGRGRLHRGAVADLVVFDPSAVADRSTYERPLLPPDGIDHVLVSGRFTVLDGELTSARVGRVLGPA